MAVEEGSRWKIGDNFVGGVKGGGRRQVKCGSVMLREVRTDGGRWSWQLAGLATHRAAYARSSDLDDFTSSASNPRAELFHCSSSAWLTLTSRLRACLLCQFSLAHTSHFHFGSRVSPRSRHREPGWDDELPDAFTPPGIKLLTKGSALHTVRIVYRPSHTLLKVYSNAYPRA